jgi:hypothetical protein
MQLGNTLNWFKILVGGFEQAKQYLAIKYPVILWDCYDWCL